MKWTVILRCYEFAFDDLETAMQFAEIALAHFRGNEYFNDLELHIEPTKAGECHE